MKDPLEPAVTMRTTLLVSRRLCCAMLPASSRALFSTWLTCAGGGVRGREGGGLVSTRPVRPAHAGPGGSDVHASQPVGTRSTQHPAHPPSLLSHTWFSNDSMMVRPGCCSRSLVCGRAQGVCQGRLRLKKDGSPQTLHPHAPAQGCFMPILARRRCNDANPAPTGHRHPWPPPLHPPTHPPTCTFSISFFTSCLAFSMMSLMMAMVRGSAIRSPIPMEKPCCSSHWLTVNWICGGGMRRRAREAGGSCLGVWGPGRTRRQPQQKTVQEPQWQQFSPPRGQVASPLLPTSHADL